MLYLCSHKIQSIMEIISIYKPYLYSVKFEGEESDEFSRLLENLTDVSAVHEFLEVNREMFDAYLGDFFRNTLEAAEQVADEADEVEDYLAKLKTNTDGGKTPDYDSYFQYLDGIYKCDIRYIPMKAYGVNYRPSLIRFYAIKVTSNVYVIAAGGIKLGRTIQESPGLKEYVFRNINKVKEYLLSNGIIDAEDMD